MAKSRCSWWDIHSTTSTTVCKILSNLSQITLHGRSSFLALWHCDVSKCTVGNFHRFSDIGDIVPQKWVKWTHRWIKCAENWFQIFLASGLYDHVAFGLENFVTLMKIGMLSRREKIFLHAKIQQIRSRNGWDTAQLMFLPWPFIYWLCKAVEANPRKSPKWAFHQ